MKRAKKVAARRPKKKTKKKITLKVRRLPRPTRGVADPFELNPKEKRAKRSYQWVTVSVMGKQYDADVDRMLDAGWNPVKRGVFRAFNKFYNKKESGIVFQGQLLMERAEKLADKAKLADKEAAQALVSDRDARLGMKPGPGSTHARFNYDAVTPASAPVIGDGSFTDLHKAARASHDNLGGVYTTIKLRLSPREIEAAAICHLTVDVYANRKLRIGCAMGEPPIVLMEVADGVFEISQLKIEKA